MPKETYQIPGDVQPFLGGVDERVDVVDTNEKFASTNGVMPYFSGMHQRMFGKKIIDDYPTKQVKGIHQCFNGICQYGYYVQTDEKLYYHLCQAPPDMRINFTLPSTLGAEESLQNRTLDIFSQPPSSLGIISRDVSHSCVFDFPDRPGRPIPPSPGGFPPPTCFPYCPIDWQPPPPDHYPPPPPGILPGSVDQGVRDGVWIGVDFTRSYLRVDLSGFAVLGDYDDGPTPLSVTQYVGGSFFTNWVAKWRRNIHGETAVGGEDTQVLHTLKQFVVDFNQLALAHPSVNLFTVKAEVAAHRFPGFPQNSICTANIDCLVGPSMAPPYYLSSDSGIVGYSSFTPIGPRTLIANSNNGVFRVYFDAITKRVYIHITSNY